MSWRTSLYFGNKLHKFYSYLKQCAMACPKSEFAIPFPSRDATGRARPAGFARRVANRAPYRGQCLRLGSKYFKTLLRSLNKKRRKAIAQEDNALEERLDRMENELWREAKSVTRGQREFRDEPRFTRAIEWRRLLRLVPRVEWQPESSRAELRRRALVYQGLWRSAKQAAAKGAARWKSTQTKEALNSRQGGRLVYGGYKTKCPPRALNVKFGNTTYKSVTRSRRDQEWRFSPYGLDYYRRCQPGDGEWLPPQLSRSLMTRGRAPRRPRAQRGRRSPQARRRR